MATIDNMRVLFGQGTSAAFVTELKEPNKLYFLTDTQEMYLGGVKYAIGKDINVQITGSGDTVSNVAWNADTKTLSINLSDAGDAPSVVEAIEVALSSCVKHIYSERGSSILVDDTDKDNVRLSLNLASGAHAGNVVLEECSDGLRANVEIPATGLVGVKDGDKILSDEGGILASTLSITTEAQNGKQYVILKGIGGVEVSKFDASDFVTSGMLQSVTLEDIVVSGQIHKFLVMTFIVEGGTTQTIRVDVQDLVDIYTAKAGGGLTLENNAFSITNETTPNYGLNTDKTIQFNSTVTLNTIMYDAHGMITGTKEITYRIPGVTGGTVGNQGTYNSLLTFVSVNETGALSGEYMNVVSEIGASASNNQIPTAKAVHDAVEDATVKWTRF